MQPLNTVDRPSSGSTIGCAPRSDRSMIFNRRWPSAVAPPAWTPQPSGPRRCIAAVMVVTAAMSAGLSSNLISPAMPHISKLLSTQDPGVLRAAAARGVDDHAAAGCDPGQGSWGHLGPFAEQDECAQVDRPRLQPGAGEGGVGGQRHQLLGDPVLRV